MPAAEPLLVLLRHLFALIQVTANGEGSVTGSGQDGDAHGGTGCDGLEDLDQLCRQFRCNGVVGMGPVEGDDGHAPAGDVLDEHQLFRLRDLGKRTVAESLHTCIVVSHVLLQYVSHMSSIRGAHLSAPCHVDGFLLGNTVIKLGRVTDQE